MTIILDEKHRLENGQLIRKTTNHIPCTKKEVINYYKNKVPLVFKTDKLLYLMSNDKVNAVNVSTYRMMPINELFIEKIYIIGDRSITQVWTNNLELRFSADEHNCIDYKDGYILQSGCQMKENGYISKSGCLMKIEQKDWICNDKETTEFFKKTLKINDSKVTVEYDQSTNQPYIIPKKLQYYETEINWG